MVLLKCYTQYASKFGKLSSGHRTGKGQFSFQSHRKAMLKNVQTTTQLHSSLMPAKLCSKFSKLGFMNWELPDVQAGFKRGRGTRNQIANIHWIIDKAREFKKNIYFCFMDYGKAFVWITTNCGTFLKGWEYQTTLPAFWEICMQVKKQQLELDMEQWTGSKLGKDYDRLCM